MDLQTLELDISNGVATVTLNRPPHNAQNAQMRSEIIQVFDYFTDAPDVKVAVITGKGKYFAQAPI